MSTVQRDMTWTDLRRADDDPRPPGSVVVGGLLVLSLAWVGTAPGLGLGAAAQTVGVAVLLVAASVWLTLPAAASAGVLAFLVVDGFVEGSYGTLGWNGSRDLLLLVGSVLIALVVAESAYEVRLALSRTGTTTSAGRAGAEGFLTDPTDGWDEADDVNR